MTYLATLYPIPPYHFPLLLDILSRYACPTVDIVRDNSYWRVLPVGESLALVRVVAQGTVDAPALDVHLMAQTGTIDKTVLLERLHTLMEVGENRSAFYVLARSDATLWRVVEPLVGVPNLRTANVFEALVQTVIEQQISWSTAQRAQRWLVEWAVNRVLHEGIAYYAFPMPEQLAVASVEELKPLKITFKRMALLVDIARQVANGQFDLEGLNTIPPEAAYRRLLEIKGIGHWTAVVTLSRAFGYYNDVAHNDVALQAAVNRYFYGGEGRVSSEIVMQTFAPYGAFAGAAAHATLLHWVLDQYPLQASE